MGYSNSSLVDLTVLSPNYSNDRKDITRLTIHHTAGIMTAQAIGNCFANKKRQASCNYGVGSDGKIVLVAQESTRAWTSGNPENDRHSITFEVSNCTGAPNWEVSDKTYRKLIELCVDICKRNGIKKVFNIYKELVNKSIKEATSICNNYKVPQGECLLTFHRYFQSTSCPGPWFYNEEKVNQITEDINKNLVEEKPSYVIENGHYYYLGVDYSSVFNPTYYYNEYADLRNAFGKDEMKLFQHFICCGSKEARQASAEFNPVYYRTSYPDLNAAYGDNWQLYYVHYVKKGKEEGRKGID